MNSLRSQSSLPNRSAYSVVAILCVALVASTSRETSAQTPPAPQPDAAAPAEEAAPKIPDAELDSLVAPIALYPDPLLSQALVASTYPVELIQLQQWTKKNTGLKDQALADAVAKQPWDPSIQGLAPFPDVVETLAGNLQWTSDLGNAFLAQQADVMAAIQRMRAKAQGTGALKTSAQQKVETQSIEGGQQAIVIQPADPNTVYVPSYDPATVYGAPAYPYPPVTYPGYVAGAALTFGTGLALGAAWGGGWGYNCGWNNGDVDVNVNNKYVNNYNKKNNINSANKNWQHNPQHRGNAPYGNKATANKYGGTARGPGGAGGAGGAGGVGKPGGAAARVALVVLEKPAEPAGREAPVVSESPGVREAQVVLAVLESPVVRAAQVVPESPAGQVVLENPVVQVGPQPEQKLAGAQAGLEARRRRWR